MYHTALERAPLVTLLAVWRAEDADAALGLGRGGWWWCCMCSLGRRATVCGSGPGSVRAGRMRALGPGKHGRWAAPREVTPRTGQRAGQPPSLPACLLLLDLPGSEVRCTRAFCRPRRPSLTGPLGCCQPIPRFTPGLGLCVRPTASLEEGLPVASPCGWPPPTLPVASPCGWPPPPLLTGQALPLSTPSRPYCGRWLLAGKAAWAARWPLRKAVGGV